MYVHVPFCVKKCFYCDFNSYTLDREAVVRYLEALRREAELTAAAESVRKASFDTLYIGGGTPTCLSGKDLKALVGGLREVFSFRPGAEVTCEANPGSSNEEKFESLLEAGVNRLSIGVQSLDDALLGRLGRTHTRDEAVRSFVAARRAGFVNVNVDLMFALPGQEFETWRRTLEEVVALAPDHLSCYSLIIEEGTPFGDAFARGKLSLPGEEAELEMFEWAIGFLEANGYEHYEISNFARPGRRSRHNQIYWRNEPYLGLGPGAHGYWDGVRYSNVRLPSDYARMLAGGALPRAEERRIPPGEVLEDAMILGLRLIEGISREEFSRRYGVRMEEAYGEEVGRLASLGLLAEDGDRVRLRRRGLFLANQVFAAFLRS